MDNKELELAVNFKNAPVEVQNATTIHYQNLKKVESLTVKQSAISEELRQAISSANESQRILKDVLKKWEPGAPK